MGIRTLVSAVLLAWLPVAAFGQPDSCPVIAKLPADLKNADPPEARRWFELVQCQDGPVTVNGVEAHKTKPTLTFETFDGYPEILVHRLIVLIFQSTGGSSSHIFVFTFRAGKPSLALRTNAIRDIQVRNTEKTIIVTVSPKTYPGPDGKFPSVPDKVYSFPLEY